MTFRASALRQNDSDKELRLERQLSLCDGQFALGHRQPNFIIIIIIIIIIIGFLL